MNTFRAKVLCVKVRNLTAIKDNFHHLGGHPPFKGLPAAKAELLQQVGQCISLSRELGLKDAEITLTRVGIAVQHDPAMDASRLQGEAQRAHDAILDNVNTLKFVFIPEPLTDYVDQDALFGDVVYGQFEQAREDIKQAGNCIAVEAGTAAVFHLMRAVEHGLRALGKKLKVSVKFKGQRQPIEYADWNDVITAVRRQIDAARQITSRREKRRRLDFYSDVADQSEYIKDVWRNTVSHTRRTYSTAEAIGVLQRVEGYMVRLAKGLPSVKIAKVSTSAASRPSRVGRLRSSAPRTP